MIMKNKQILKGIVYNTLLFFTLVDGNASENDLKGEDLDKSRSYKFSPKYKTIARKYGHDNDKMRAPVATTSLAQDSQEFRSKASELLEKIKEENEQQNRIGRSVVNITMDVAKKEIKEKVEDKALKESISEALDIIGDSIKNFFFGNSR